MDVCDLGGGSGPPRLHTGGAKNLWVKKNHHTRGERLKIATYNVRTLLKDEHVQELEEELKENNMKWDVIGLGEVRRKEESFTTLQSGHLLYHSEANNGQAGVGFLVNKKWKDNITRVSSGNSRVAELVLRITDRYHLKIVQVYATTTSHSDEETDNFYNTIDKILEKQTHYTIVMGDFNAKVGGQTNTSERATGCFGLGQRNERGDTLVEWATSKNFKIMNTQFQKKAGRRWTWRSPDGHTRNEIDYIMTDKPSMVTDVTVINRINIGSDHRMVMGSITLNTRAERRKLLNKNTRTRVDTQMIGTKKNTFQLELKNRFTALEEHDDMDSLNKNMTEIIQQSAMSIAKQTKRQKKPKISSPTKALMKKRREMIENNTPRDHIEYVEICKTIKKKAREDIRKHNLDEIRETIEASKSLKKVRRTQNLGKNRMITLLDKHGKEIQEQDKIMERIEEFYSELYDSDQAVTIQTVPKEVPPIMAWEVEAALRKMKNGKEAGKDQVNIETLKAGDETIAKQLAKLYTKCITERRIPKTWKEANMVIFFKKGNRKDIKNYRPICLLSNMYKLFTKIITTRLEKKLDENQPREQAGFRSKYSTTDHIHAINQLKEKCREYNIPLCVAFVDYEKAFDSVQTQAILTSLQEQGIEDVYIEILKDIYTDSSVTVHLHKESEKIRIKRGVRQGDTISPKLFTATLESIFRRLNWEHKGVKIDGEFLSNLRFADDIFLCTETPQELQQMLQELSDESRRMGLKMNIAKTKVMVVDNTPININNVLIENVQGYVYLGQHYSLKEKNQDKEIQRRIMAGWAAYAKHRDIFKSNLAICLKRQVYNSCVLPAMTYGAETWTLTKQAQNKLTAAQTKMERSMLNITYKDRKTNIWVRERTKVIDIINTVRKMKWSWAGHINRLKDDRWTSRVTSWRPYDKKRRQGRPAKRWRDDLDKYWSDTIWQRKAQDRVVWRRHAEAFAQPRDTTAA